jgi:peptide/nickel transport system substrate-binding protein
VVAVEAGPGPIDPRRGGSQATSRVNDLLFEGLVRVGADGAIEPCLASSWEISDPLTYVFTLKDGVTFHDGSRFGSEDVKATLETILSPDFPSYRKEDFHRVASVEAPDPLTVVVRLERPFAPLLFNLAVGIVPAEAGTDPGEVLPGTGPYRLAEHRPDRHVDFTRFESYHGQPARMEAIRYKIVPNVTVRMLELRKGSAHMVVNDLTPDILEQFRDNPGFQVMETDGCTYSYIGFNMDHPLLALPEVRRAMAMAIDIDEMVTHWARGTAVPATGLIPPMAWAWVPDLPVPPFDPAGARDLLDRAGLPDPDGPAPRFSLEFKGTTSDISRQKAAIFKEYLATVGVELKIRQLEWGTFYEDVKKGAFQVYSLNWTGIGLLDPDILRTRFHSALAPPNGLNRGRYANPEVDRLLEAGMASPFPGERYPIYAEAQRLIAEDLPYISLWYKKSYAVLRQGLDGFTVTPTGDFFHLKDVYDTSSDNR